MLSRLGILSLALAVALGVAGCQNAPAPGGSGVSDEGASSGVDSVGDVGSGAGVGGASRPVPFDGAAKAKIRNESSSQVDVTLRFLKGSDVVQLAFVRVPASTVTMVAANQKPERLELTNISHRGLALPDADFLFGVDFDADHPAEYIVRDGAVESDPEVKEPSLKIVEPSSDLDRVLGTSLLARWTDEAVSEDAVVRVFLRRQGSDDEKEWASLGAASFAGVDGLGDEAIVVVEGVQPGQYELVGRLYDGDSVITSVAAGRVRVARATTNVPPRLRILEPMGLSELRADQRLDVRWEDDDPDSSAFVSFLLEGADANGSVAGSFVISPPFAEDADGDSADSASLSLVGVLPGLYDLVGVIDGGASGTGGHLTGTARLEKAVRVLPAVRNDSPRLELTAPSAESRVKPGESLTVRWIDADDNDDARISILIDDRIGAIGLNGNEKLLLTGVSEDADGPGDEALITIPSDTKPGLYRIVGLITDGVTQVVTRAPGALRVLEPDKVGGGASEEDSDDNPDKGDGQSDDDKSDDDKSDDDKADDGKTDDGSDDSGGPNQGGDSNDDPADGGDDSGGDSGSGDDVGDGGGDGSGDDAPPDDGGDKSDGDDGKEDGSDGKDDDASDGKDEDPPVDDAPPADGPDGDGGNGGNGDDKDGDGSGSDLPDDSASGGNPSGLRPTGIYYVIDRTATRPRDPVRLVVSNERSGGDFSVDVGDLNQRLDEEGQLIIELPLSAIPNTAWPRTFDLVARPTGGVASSIVVSRAPVVVPQSVEVEDAALVHYACFPAGGVRTGSGFAGLEFSWYGGGVEEQDEGVTVEFWLSRDRFVPSAGSQDEAHRLLLRTTGSPNVVVTSRIELGNLIGSEAAVFAGLRSSSGASNPVAPLAPGSYRLMIVETRSDGHRVVSGASIVPITLCDPAGLDRPFARP